MPSSDSVENPDHFDQSSIMAMCMSGLHGPMAVQSAQRRSTLRCFISTNRSPSVAALPSLAGTAYTQFPHQRTMRTPHRSHTAANLDPPSCRALPASAQCQVLSAPCIQQRRALTPAGSRQWSSLTCRAAVGHADLESLKEKFGTLGPQSL